MTNIIQQTQHDSKLAHYPKPMLALTAITYLSISLLLIMGVQVEATLWSNIRAWTGIRSKYRESSTSVVGCGDATIRLRTGDRVLVDGRRGVVEILETT